jgi:hypothetical protein
MNIITRTSLSSKLKADQATSKNGKLNDTTSKNVLATSNNHKRKSLHESNPSDASKKSRMDTENDSDEYEDEVTEVSDNEKDSNESVQKKQPLKKPLEKKEHKNTKKDSAKSYEKEENERYTVKFAGNDLLTYHTVETNVTNKDGLIECFKIFKPKISIYDIKVYKKEDELILSLVVEDEEDYLELMANNILEIKSKNTTLLRLTLAKIAQKYVFAVKNVPISFNVKNQSNEITKIIEKWDLVSLERKKNGDAPTTALIGMTTNKVKFVELLKEGCLLIQNRKYQIEVWIFRPCQCYNCGLFEHIANECEHEAKCIKCNTTGHVAKDCTKKGLQLKCMFCDKNHAATSLQCDRVRDEYKKTNRSYAKLCKKNNIMDKGIERIFRKVPKDTITQYESGDESTTHNKTIQANGEVQKLYKMYEELVEKSKIMDKDIDQLFTKTNQHTQEINVQSEFNKEVESCFERTNDKINCLGLATSQYIGAKETSIINYIKLIKAVAAPNVQAVHEPTHSLGEYLMACEKQSYDDKIRDKLEQTKKDKVSKEVSTNLNNNNKKF